MNTISGEMSSGRTWLWVMYVLSWTWIATFNVGSAQVQLCTEDLCCIECCTSANILPTNIGGGFSNGRCRNACQDSFTGRSEECDTLHPSNEVDRESCKAGASFRNDNLGTFLYDVQGFDASTLCCTATSALLLNAEALAQCSLPTSGPTTSPTSAPTTTPTLAPSIRVATGSPSQTPTTIPTQAPSAAPSASPTVTSSVSPTLQPTRSPTLQPTGSPTLQPTENPTQQPSDAPTPSQIQVPSSTPTESQSSGPGDQDVDDPIVVAESNVSLEDLIFIFFIVGGTLSLLTLSLIIGVYIRRRKKRTAIIRLLESEQQSTSTNRCYIRKENYLQQDLFPQHQSATSIVSYRGPHSFTPKDSYLDISV